LILTAPSIDHKSKSGCSTFSSPNPSDAPDQRPW
jgi:hypothetical protein